MIKKLIVLFSYLLSFNKGSSCAGFKNQTDYQLQNNYGVKCIELDLWNEADFHLKKALEIDKNNASVYNNLGVVYEHFNLREKALELYCKALELVPNEKVYQKNVDSFKIDYGNKEQKMEKWRKEEKRKDKKSILTKSIIIQQEIQPKVNIDGFARVGIFAFFEKDIQKEAYNSKPLPEITQILADAFRMTISLETPFYLLDDYEIKTLTEDVEISQESLKKDIKRIQLCQAIEADGFFIINLSNLTDQQKKDFDVLSSYSEKQKKFIYEPINSITRIISADIDIWFFDKQGRMLWHNRYNDESASALYKGKDVVLTDYDANLLKKLIKKPAAEFLSIIAPQKRFYNRLVVLER